MRVPWRSRLSGLPHTYCNINRMCHGDVILRPIPIKKKSKNRKIEVIITCATSIITYYHQLQKSKFYFDNNLLVVTSIFQVTINRLLSKYLLIFQMKNRSSFQHRDSTQTNGTSDFFFWIIVCGQHIAVRPLRTMTERSSHQLPAQRAWKGPATRKHGVVASFWAKKSQRMRLQRVFARKSTNLSGTRRK